MLGDVWKSLFEPHDVTQQPHPITVQVRMTQKECMCVYNELFN